MTKKNIRATALIGWVLIFLLSFGLIPSLAHDSMQSVQGDTDSAVTASQNVTTEAIKEYESITSEAIENHENLTSEAIEKQEKSTSEAINKNHGEVKEKTILRAAAVNVSTVDQLNEVIANGQDGVLTSLKVTSELKGTIIIPEKKVVEIDMGGKNISSNDDYSIIVSGSLKFIQETGHIHGGNKAAVLVNNTGEYRMAPLVSIINNDVDNVIGLINKGKSNLGGGTIRNCSSGGIGGAVYNEGTFIIESYSSIKNNHAKRGAGVYNTKTGVVTLSKGCTISYNTSYEVGGAVYNEGKFSMDNGTMLDNTSGYAGAIFNSGEFNMSGGTMSRNKADYGGAIYNSNIFKMSGATIQTSEAKYSGSAFFNTTEGSLSISGGNILQNKIPTYNNTYGGGIIENFGIADISGGTFEKNTIQSSRDGVISNNKELLVSENALIKGNTADGIVNKQNATCKIRGGNITGNTRGVYIHRNSSFDMNGGAVFENKSGSSPVKYNDIEWVDDSNFPTESPKINIIKASDMEANSYVFTSWCNDDLAYETTESLSAKDAQKANSDNGLSVYAKIGSKPGAETDGIFLNGISGNNNNNGTSSSSAVKTFEQAKTLLDSSSGLKNIYITETVTITGDEEWSLSNDQYLMRYSGLAGNMVNVSETGVLTLKNIVIDGRKGGLSGSASAMIKVSQGKLNLSQGSVLENNRITNPGRGGAVDISGGTLTMDDGSSIKDNRAGYGAGICVSNDGVFNMNGGEITQNTAINDGGAVILITGAEMNLKSGNITSNQAINGSGISIGGNSAEMARPGSTLNMTGGNISYNEADSNGGGIYVQDESVATVSKGHISNNKAWGVRSPYAGGGIYVNGGRMASGEEFGDGILYLSKAVISDNKATSLGGGIAACPTGQTKLYFKNGSAIYDNTSKASEQIYCIKLDRNENTFISDYMLGGGQYKWLYSDGVNGKYEVDNNYYQNTNNTIQLDNQYKQEDADKARNNASVFITNNYSAHFGGGIGTNGTVIIGDAPESKLIVNKLWVGDDESDRPNSIRLKMKIADYPIKEFQLTKDDNWNKTIIDLPDDFWAQTDPKLECEEIKVNGYTNEIDTHVDKDNKTITVDVKNTLEVDKFGSLNIRKTVTGTNSSAKPFNFTISLTDSAGIPLSDEFPFTGTGVKDGKITNGDNFMLSKDQEINIKNIPEGTKYEIIESDANMNGYVTTSNNSKGTITDNITAYVVYNNDLKSQVNPKSTYVNLAANKLLNNKKPKENIFKFELRDNSGNVIQTVKNKGSQVSFSPIEYKAVGTYKYTIREKVKNNGDISYDKKVYRVTVTITEANGQLVSSTKYYQGNGNIKGIPTFKNYTEEYLNPELEDEGPEGVQGQKKDALNGENGWESKTFDSMSISILLILVLTTGIILFFKIRKSGRN